jgi:hypothetical protein
MPIGAVIHTFAATSHVWGESELICETNGLSPVALSKMTPCFDEPALKLPKLICKFDFVIPK